MCACAYIYGYGYVCVYTNYIRYTVRIIIKYLHFNAKVKLRIRRIAVHSALSFVVFAVS